MPIVLNFAAVMLLQNSPAPASEPQIRTETRVIVIEDAGRPPVDAREREMLIRIPGESSSRVVRLPHDDGLSADARIEVRRFGDADDEAELDADGDGRISQAEFTAPLREAFTRMDADGSGYLEAAERDGDRRVHVFTHRETAPAGD